MQTTVDGISIMAAKDDGVAAEEEEPKTETQSPDDNPGDEAHPSSDRKSSSQPQSTPSALSSTTTKRRCIFISGVILLSHALFIWGQVDILWAQFAYAKVDVDVTATTKNITAASIDNEQQYLVAEWSYGGMLAELWIYSKITAVFLFLFSALWPHMKLVLLHFYFYWPIPSKPRQAALYWLDTFGKFSLADVCATCMLFLLLNLEEDIDAGALRTHGTQIMEEMVPFIKSSILPNKFSNETQTILDKAGTWAYEELGTLTDSIFEKDDPTIYQSILEAGCSEFYNDGASCIGTTFFEPSDMVGGIAGIMVKCLRTRDKCGQCECIVNNAIYNRDIAAGVLQSKTSNAMSTMLAKLLLATKAGDINFASWFDISGDAYVGSYIRIHPAFLGFTFGVILSIAASLIVSHVEEKDHLRRYRNASSLTESLENAGVDQKSTQLFAVDGSSRLTRLLAIIGGIGIIPLVFFAIYVLMFELSISGLLQQLVMVQAASVQKFYSIIDTVIAVNDGTGYGKTFAVLYGTMMLAIPMLRATLLALVSLVPMSPLWQVRFARMSNNVGSYLAWEPFFICVLLLTFQLPAMTENTISPEECQQIEEGQLMSRLISSFGLDDTNTCFVMYFALLPAVALFVVSWACLTGFNVMAWKVVVKRYDPFGTHAHEQDAGGPYCSCRKCCYFGCCRKKEQAQESNTNKDKIIDEEG